MDDIILTIICAAIVIMVENLLIFAILFANIVDIHKEIKNIIDKIYDKVVKNK